MKNTRTKRLKSKNNTCPKTSTPNISIQSNLTSFLSQNSRRKTNFARNKFKLAQTQRSRKLKERTAEKDPRAQKPQGINNYRAVLTMKRKQKAVKKKRRLEIKHSHVSQKKVTGE